MLVAAVVGSGVMAQRLSPRDVGFQLLVNALATAFALVAILLALGPVSGAHLNPVVTAVEAADRRMPRGRVPWAYAAAQVAGGALGAVLANLMFGRMPATLSTTERGGGAIWLAEAFATFGLVLVVRGVARSKTPQAVPFAVGAYVGGAYFFASSTSFANPAVTLARTLSDTFAGIAPASAPAFLAAQAVGGFAGWLAARALFPEERPVRPPTVLFLCVHNAGRSRMAAAMLARRGEGRVRVRSGGSAPGERVHPRVVAAMREEGYDLSAEEPRAFTDADLRAADVVVTMGCGEACPAVPGKRYEDWPVEDPAGKDADAVRRIRDEIGRRVDDLLARLSGPTS
jgi:arsenate reductase